MTPYYDETVEKALRAERRRASLVFRNRLRAVANEMSDESAQWSAEPQGDDEPYQFLLRRNDGLILEVSGIPDFENHVKCAVSLYLTAAEWRALGLVIKKEINISLTKSDARIAREIARRIAPSAEFDYREARRKLGLIVEFNRRRKHLLKQMLNAGGKSFSASADSDEGFFSAHAQMTEKSFFTCRGRAFADSINLDLAGVPPQLAEKIMETVKDYLSDLQK